MRALPLASILLASSLVAACGSDTEMPGSTASGSTSGAVEAHPPAWTDAPTAPVPVGQGQSLTLPLSITDADGDAVTVAIDAATVAADLEVTVTEGQASLLVHAGYATSGATSFDVVLDDGGDAPARATVTLDVKPLRWVSELTWGTADGPEAREHATMLEDAAHGRAFLFGGSGYAPQLTPLGDAWRLDLATGVWTAITPTGDVPPAGGSRRAAGVAGAAVAYVWGGYGAGSTNFDDLYRVTIAGDTLDFKLITQQSTPPKRSLHVFAFDALHDRFVLFGGASTKPLGDTWVMEIEGDTATWTELPETGGPTPRYGAFAGVDEASHRLVVFSGAQGFSSIKAAADTWALDFTGETPVWQLVDDGASGAAPGRRNGCAVFDPAGPRLVVFGGTSNGMTTEPGLFLLDARPGKGTWTALDLADGPPLRSSGFGFYDPSADRSWMGFGNDAKVYRDLWSLGY